MSLATKTVPKQQSRQQRKKTWVPTTLTLALWQLSRTWGLLLIVGIGILASVIPALLFTSSTGADMTSEELYLAQNIPPIQIIVPTVLGIAVAVLLGVCVVALGMMVRIVSCPGIAQTLRLNED